LTTYDDVTSHLRNAYAKSASSRDEMAKHPWKLEERQRFLERLRDGGAKSLLEIGAGTGQDSVFFRDSGLDVVATDLTPEMVEFCRAKGLDARVMDVLNLELPDGSFDAVWTINCLLHVPSDSLPDALSEIARVLKPGGLSFLGVYSTEPPSEGINEGDNHDPKRFFAFRTDDHMLDAVRERFDVVDFHVIDLPAPARAFRFQSFTARRRAGA
jgi:SAM-dependent methyltransferase